MLRRIHRLLRKPSADVVLVAVAVALSALAGWFVVWVQDPHLPDAGPAQAAPSTITTSPMTAATATVATTTAAAGPTPAPPVTTPEKLGTSSNARPARKPKPASRNASAPRPTVTVRVDPSARPSFVCVDDGRGHQLFGGILAEAKTFKARRVRLNVGLNTTVVTVDGKPVPLAESPAGLDVTRAHGALPLPLGQRPCS
jgi:hypothetical protein